MGTLRLDRRIRGLAAYGDRQVAGPHHGLPKRGDLSPEAKDQIRDFGKARNGLIGHAGYLRITAVGVADHSWKDYRRGYGVSLSGLEQAFATRTAGDDVREPQWALSRHLGVDVVGDRDPGPETRQALDKIGPLTTETLTRLGLVVLP